MPNDPTPPNKLAEEVGARAQRKLVARRDGAPGVWSGLGTMGLIGWSVVVPTLLGAMLGSWLDSRYPGKHSWTLALLMAGLVLGCLNAWHWVAGQDKAMHAAGVASGVAADALSDSDSDSGADAAAARPAGREKRR